MKVRLILFFVCTLCVLTSCGTSVPQEVKQLVEDGVNDKNEEMADCFEEVLPDGYNYEKIRTSFLEYINYYAWYNPSEWPQEGCEFTCEIYRPQKKENMKDIVHCIWMKCSMEDSVRWYECYALTNGKLANWIEEYNFYYTTIARDTGENSIYLGKDTISLPAVTKPEYVEDEEQNRNKGEIFEDLKNDVRVVYEKLREGGYDKDLSIELYVSDFSGRSDVRPYSCLLINDEEGFICQFKTGRKGNKGYAEYDEAFKVNYSVDVELSQQYSSGSVIVFDGNQIKTLDEIDKLSMERIKESAVFQYRYSGEEG